jgi:hypothetical protein
LPKDLSNEAVLVQAYEVIEKQKQTGWNYMFGGGR